jgi:hypothetical protein
MLSNLKEYHQDADLKKQLHTQKKPPLNKGFSDDKEQQNYPTKLSRL